ncbi:hypothetical protein MHU86_16536 [Fragilaria crotonensis]|nr:hypothetical protein MHU86_16536 [Fragilaria crotonensis]
MAVDTKQIVRSHVGTPYDWSKMLTWNSTSDVRRAIEELVTTRSSVSGVSESAGQASAPAREPPVAATRGRPKGSAPRGRSKSSKHTNETNDQDKTNDADADDTEDVTVVGFTMKPTVPVPAFIAAAIMESYVTDPEELALMIVRTIKQRASEDPDPTGRRGWPKQRPTYLDGFSALQRAPEPLTVQQSGEWRLRQLTLGERTTGRKSYT